ncbi:MAG TPA: hypothetical protein PLN91_10460 [Rhodanobacteraceae bacterium]|nr:hypothetical protein [Rhodanobacteraceae bacterium]
MRHLRVLEARVLGYAIERIEERDHLGTTAVWFEVLCPDSGAVLGSGATRAEAERVVIRRELDAARRAVTLNRGHAAA